MKFLTPAGLGLLAAVPVIVTLYLLKLRRERRTVPSTWLWEKTLAEMRADTPFQRLRSSLPLLLQIVAAILLALAAARPVRSGVERLGDTVILVLDNSASMQARADDSTRFENARRTLSAYLAAAEPGDRAALILAGKEPVVAAALTQDLNAVQAALRSARPSDGEADPRAAVGLGAAMAAGSRSPHIILATDDARGIEDLLAARASTAPGAAVLHSPSAAGPEGGHAAPGQGITLVDAGGPAENAGIVSFSHRLTETGVEAFVGVRNFAAKPRLARLELELDGSLVDSRTLELDAGERRGTIVALPPDAAGMLRARLDAGDALAADDEAFLSLRDEGLLRVLLVTNGNLFLETAWALEPHVVLDKAKPDDFKSIRADAYDLIAFDRWFPGTLPPGSYMLFGAGSPSLGVRAGPLQDGVVAVTEQALEHPLMRHADLERLRIGRTRALRVEPWATVLARSEQGPLLVAVEHEGRKAVVCAFSLLDSDWPLRVSFPIFLSNATVWLASSDRDPWSGSLKPGDAVRLDTREFRYGENVSIAAPDGGSAQMPAGPDSTYRDTFRTGVYTLKSEGLTRKFAVSLLSEKESELQQGRAQGARAAPVPGHAPGRVLAGLHLTGGREAWRGALIAALFVLMAEWGVYLYRKSL